MIWSWLIGSRLGRALSGAVIALGLFWTIIAQQRSDARKDALHNIKEKDRDNAHVIRDRVRDVPNKLRDYTQRGFRD